MKVFNIIILAVIFWSCAENNSGSHSNIEPDSKITFVELGSVSCIPCQKMQPVMKSLEEKYGEEQLQVQFIDVLRDREAAKPYNIRVMPTQVFLERNGKEFHRHEGFYPEEEIDSLLQAQGLKPL
ncbi:MAG: thioredoxin family protein [Candidatus Kapaibacterium sp.]